MAYVYTTPTQARIVLGTADRARRLDVPVSAALFDLCAQFTPREQAEFLRVLTLVLQSSAEAVYDGQTALGMTPLEPVDPAAS
jgi:hypothetical protein